MSIATKAMTVNVSIGLWSGQRLDKDATRKVTSEAGADADAARVNKHLIPKEVFKGITQAANAVRAHFYTKTLPWKDNGDRLLPRAIYTEFIQEHKDLVDGFHKEVDLFLSSSYREAVSKASFRMGDLFNIQDYPTPAQLRTKFYVTLDIDAVTEAQDFRVQMDTTEQDRIKAGIEAALNDRLGLAMRDVWERVSKVLSHFAEKTADKDAVFRNTLVTNLTDLLDILPGLNITDDPNLAAVEDDLRAMLKGIEPDDLRKHPEVRAEAADKAAEIMETMAGFMRAFGGDE